MITPNIIIACVCLVILILFLIYKNFAAKKTNQPLAVSNIDNLPSPASFYSKPKDNDQKMTLKERLELSWKFLYEITEIIVNKFTREDSDLIVQMGHKLIDNGMRYEHVIDLGIKQDLAKAKTQEQSQGAAARGV